VRSANSLLHSEFSPGLNARSTDRPRATACTSRASSEEASNVAVLIFRSTAVSLAMEAHSISEFNFTPRN
jgi:hypothetical protein